MEELSGPILYAPVSVPGHQDLSGPILYIQASSEKPGALRDLSGPMAIDVNGSSQSGSETMPCEVFVLLPAAVTMGAEVFVMHTGSQTCPGRIGVQFSGSQTMYGDVNVMASITCPGRIIVDASVLLMGEVNVFVPRITVLLYGEVNVMSNMTVPAEVFVQHAGSQTCQAEVNVLQAVLMGECFVHHAFSLTVPAFVTVVPDLPTLPGNLRCNVPAAVYSPENHLVFQWDASTAILHPITGYRYSFDQNAISAPEDDWVNLDAGTLTATVNLPNLGPSGTFYFHVAAVNAIGTGPVASYEILHNTPPSVPGTNFMTADGIDTLLGNPLLAFGIAPTFAWSPSADQDQGDVITYTVRFATQPDFGIDSQTDASSIAKVISNIGNSSLSFSPNLQPGDYFWSIQASDGKQSSGWSRVGAFMVNSPPLRVTGLAVSQ